MISILQNFIISKTERFNILKNEILPDVATFFDKYEFIINYNSTKNFDKVYKLYSSHIKKLTFYNDLTKNWGLILQSMISQVTSDYVLLFPEDFKLILYDKTYFLGLMSEIKLYDCKFIAMHRIDDVKCYGTDKKYFHLYDTKKYIHLTKSNVCPTSCLSSVAIYNTKFLLEYLNYYNSQTKSDRFKLSTPHSFEWFSAHKINTMFDNMQFGIPKRALFRHYEPNSIKERTW